MTTTRIEGSQSSVNVEPTRARQTRPPERTFESVLGHGARVLMSGVEVAAHAVGGPLLAAPVREARASLDERRSGGAPRAAGGDVGPASAAAGRDEGGAELATMFAMQRESQAFNLQLLALQEESQDESRRFTTLSNLLRATHDTAKAAVANIRSGRPPRRAQRGREPSGRRASSDGRGDPSRDCLAARVRTTPVRTRRLEGASRTIFRGPSSMVG
jgi:hypothetical protein